MTPKRAQHFSEDQVIAELRKMQASTFFGKLLIKSVGGRITDMEVSMTRKPYDADTTERRVVA